MNKSAKQKARSQFRSVSPLWIIASFVTLTEVIATTGIALVDGHTQLLLTYFVVSFPVAVFVLLFAVLVWRPYILYAPKDFGSEVNVKDYVAAMQPNTLVDARRIVREVRNEMIAQYGAETSNLQVKINSLETFMTRIQAEAINQIETVREQINRLDASGTRQLSKDEFASLEEIAQRLSLLEIAGAPATAGDFRARAQALKYQNEIRPALEMYDRALQIDPDDAQSWTEKALLLNDIRKHEEAFSAADIATKLRPNSIEAWMVKASAATGLGHVSQCQHRLKSGQIHRFRIGHFRQQR